MDKLYESLFWLFASVNVVLLFLLPFTSGEGGLCFLPLKDGTWFSSTRGTWTITNNQTEIHNFSAKITATKTVHDLVCFNKTGDRYILRTKSQIELFSGVFSIFMYTCIELRILSLNSASYEFTFITDDAADNLPMGEPFSSLGDCEGAGKFSTSVQNFLVAKGAYIENIKAGLPNVLRGQFRVIVTDQTGISRNESVLGLCYDENVLCFSYTTNATFNISPIAFSESGLLYIIKTFSLNGVTYMYTFNNDSKVNPPFTYRFACWAVRQHSSTVYTTTHPDTCMDGQNATFVSGSGQRLVLVPLATTSRSSSTISIVGASSTDAKTTKMSHVDTKDADNKFAVIVSIPTAIVLTLVIAVIILILWKRGELNKTFNSCWSRTVAKARAPSAVANLAYGEDVTRSMNIQINETHEQDNTTVNKTPLESSDKDAYNVIQIGADETKHTYGHLATMHYKFVDKRFSLVTYSKKQIDMNIIDATYSHIENTEPSVSAVKKEKESETSYSTLDSSDTKKWTCIMEAQETLSDPEYDRAHAGDKYADHLGMTSIRT